MPFDFGFNRLTGIARDDLGLGSMLQDQTKTETEDQKKKRLGIFYDAQKPMQAVQSLFGSLGGLGGLSGTGGFLGSRTRRL